MDHAGQTWRLFSSRGKDSRAVLQRFTTHPAGWTVLSFPERETAEEKQVSEVAFQLPSVGVGGRRLRNAQSPEHGHKQDREVGLATFVLVSIEVISCSMSLHASNSQKIKPSRTQTWLH